jgi:hypothetical protein
MVLCQTGCVSKEQLFELMVWICCGEAERKNHEGEDSFSIGAADSLCRPLEEAGHAVRELEEWATEVMSAPSSHTAGAVARICWDTVKEFRVCLLSLSKRKEKSLPMLIDETQKLRRRLVLLLELVREQRKHESQRVFIDIVCGFCERELLLQYDVDFVLCLNAAVMTPLCRMVQELMRRGQISELLERKLLDADECPRVMRGLLERLLCVGRTVKLLNVMGEQQSVDALEETSSWTVISKQCEHLYFTECRRLVSVILVDRGGLAAARKLRESFGALPESTEWPVSELLCSEANRQKYFAVGRFVNAMQRTRKGCFFFFFFFFFF